MQNTSQKKIKIFCYGSNADGGLFEHVIGRKINKSEVHPYTLKDYELCIQDVDQLRNENVKKIINEGWFKEGMEFHTYTLRGKIGSEVKGSIIEVTEEEYRKINNWEIVEGVLGGVVSGQGMQDELEIEMEDGTILVTQGLKYGEARPLNKEDLEDNEYGYRLFPSAPGVEQRDFGAHIFNLAERVRKKYENKVLNKENNRVTTIPYFAFGANYTREMMRAIIDNVDNFSSKIDSFEADAKVVLSGYELCYKDIEGVDKNTFAHNILLKSWDEQGQPFRSFYIRQSSENSKVCGTVWNLTPAQYACVRHWELINDNNQTELEHFLSSFVEGSMPDKQGMQADIEINGRGVVTQVLTKTYEPEKAKKLEEEMRSSEFPFYQPFIGDGHFKYHILKTAILSRKIFFEKIWDKYVTGTQGERGNISKNWKDINRKIEECDKEISRLEKLYSEWKGRSDVTRIDNFEDFYLIHDPKLVTTENELRRRNN